MAAPQGFGDGTGPGYGGGPAYGGGPSLRPTTPARKSRKGLWIGAGIGALAVVTAGAAFLWPGFALTKTLSAAEVSLAVEVILIDSPDDDGYGLTGVSDVECPADQMAAVGTRFDCVVRFDDGQSESVGVRIIGDPGSAAAHAAYSVDFQDKNGHLGFDSDEVEDALKSTLESEAEQRGRVVVIDDVDCELDDEVQEANTFLCTVVGVGGTTGNGTVVVSKDSSGNVVIDEHTIVEENARSTTTFDANAVAQGTLDILTRSIPDGGYAEEGVKDVECPADQSVVQGTTFDCTVNYEDGTKRTTTITVTGDENDPAEIGKYTVGLPK